MAHEITSVDGVVLAGKRAWHGLGTVVEQAPTAVEALKLAGLDWTVQRMPVSTMGMDGACDVTDDYRALRRSDTNELFGIVGDGWRPVQNREHAEFMDAMGADGSVKIESAGSIRGGRRVWFLARGESVWASDSDEVRTYLLVANGHDGTLSVTCQPTSVRVVCSNTLHMALGASARAIRFKHEGDIRAKLDEAKRALGLFSRTRDGFATQVQALNARTMGRDDLQRFWLEVYSETIDPIPANPTTKAEREAAQDARVTLMQWARNFDKDRAKTGGDATAWTALNAVTEWWDHQRAYRGADNAARSEARTNAKLWGMGADAKSKAMETALALV